MPALCSAIRTKRFRQAKILIEMGVDVNFREEKYRRTPMIELCFLEEEAKAAKIGKLLLANGAKVGLRDKHGLNSLHYACKYGREQLVSLMMEEAHTFDPNTADKDGNTALHYAAKSGNFVVLNLLIKTLKSFKLTVDKGNNNGETPLICASKAGHFLCARILVSEGRASKHARDKISFKSASEWEKTEESLHSAAKSPLFMTLQLKPREENDEDLETSEEKPRPYTAPVRGTVVKRPKSHRDDLRKLFQYYEGQFTSAYRTGVKKPIKIELEVTEDSMSECSDISELADSFPSGLEGRLLRRMSMSKTANTALTTNSAFRRRSIATTGLSSGQSRRLSLSSSSDFRKGSPSGSTPKLRRGSINVIAKLNVPPQSPKQNTLNVSPKGRRGSLDVRSKVFDAQKRSISPRSRSPFSDSKLMNKLQTLNEASDDENEEEEDIFQRSSPAAMQSINT